MAEFESEVELSITVPERELRTARQTIQDGIGSIEVGIETGAGAASRATGGGRAGGGAAGRMQRRTFRWARQRTEDINEATAYLADIAENITGGGMGGGGGGGGLGGIAGSAVGRVGGSLIGGVSASALIQKVPLKSLLKKAPAFATLVTAADLAGDLVTGKLTADDIISAPIELGDQITFGALDNEAVEGAIGTVTLAIGTYQIGSIITGTLSGTALASYFGSISIGSILSGIGTGATSLVGLLTASGAVSIAALVGGTLSLADLVDGDISDWNLPARFGKKLGEGVKENFPNLAKTIRKQMTDNNPFYQLGEQMRKFLDDDYQGRSPEEYFNQDEVPSLFTEGKVTSAPGYDPSNTPNIEPDLDIPQNTQGDLAPGQIGRRDGKLVVGQEGGGTERAININVTDNKSIVVERDISDSELVKRLVDLGVSPDRIDEIERKIDQAQRGSAGSR